MMHLAKTVRTGLRRNRSDSDKRLLAIALGGFGGQDQTSDNDALLRPIEKRFLAGIQRVSKPAGADILDVCDALDQGVVNRMRLAQRSEFDCQSSHDVLPAGVVVFFAGKASKHGTKPYANHKSRVEDCKSQVRVRCGYQSTTLTALDVSNSLPQMPQAADTPEGGFLPLSGGQGAEVAV